MLLSTVLGEVTTRCINFIISKCPKPQVLDVDDHLRKLLLRAQVIIDEAMGRHITNHAMLQQLDMLRDAMHRGDYILDTFRYQSHDDDSKHQVVSRHSSSLSRMNSLKGFCSSTRETQILEQLQWAYDSLNSMVVDVEGLVVFLVSYPRMYRQPYSMHLLLGNCMFGRQMEAEVVLTFLLHKQHSGAEELEVLPIVGPGKVGKSTLVSHVCHEERVRNHFSEIVFLNDHDFKDGKLSNLVEGFEKKYHNFTLNKDWRMLLVVEVIEDFNKGEWKMLYDACKRCMTNGSKIIITSRSDRIIKLGTSKPVILKLLSQEAYWYFFKTLTFGSTDPVMHPRLSCLAMEIASMLNRCLFSGAGTIGVLRNNFNISYWCRVVIFLRWFMKWHESKFSEHPSDALNQNRPTHLGRMVSTSEEIVVYNQYECSSQDEVPKIEFPSVMYGSVKPSGRFETQVLRSTIPPYYSYIFTCEIRDLKTTTAKRKRS
ncbi:hypothetical protein HU200_060844 [Digitaria exilis]|uniref:NB-ARC domain-containing protein n=1 Tax=Digitaria exilis TaxID=1010633 RepID=A0A835E012_9POAL|nr:hypothetical protein HU200_060844 [Digitaria exilis]